MIGFNTDAGIVENIVENIVETNSITAMQIEIIELMQSNPKISARAISEKVGIAPRNVQSHIQTLKRIGVVERAGAAKGGHWIVKLAGEQLPKQDPQGAPESFKGGH